MMKKRLLFILCLFSLASGAAVAQTKTVTNQDLEKFRQQRLQAERDYRENYAKLGFPSPEELERQREQGKRERAELSRQIREENLEREKIQIEAEYRQAQLEALHNNRVNQVYSDSSRGFYNSGYYPGVYAGSYPFYGYYGYSNGYFNNLYRGGFSGRRGNIYASPGFSRHTGTGVRVNIRIGGGNRGGNNRGGSIGGRRR